MTTEEKIDVLLNLMTEERALNNSRFVQLSSGLSDVRNEVKGVKADIKAMDLKVDSVHASLSADINAFGDELYENKRRVSRLEKRHS